MTKLKRSLGRLVTLTCLMVFLGGCATFYVDSALSDAKVDSQNHPSAPHPTQLIFNFQSKGVNNTKATEFLQEHVKQAIDDSHLFSEISTTPPSGGSLLSITIDNVPVTSESDAAAKGFATGFTFGLVGSTVSDGYNCTIEYFPGGSDAKVEARAQHMIHTTIGAKGAPKTGIKAKNADEAVITMTKQIITSALDNLSKNHEFK